MFLFFLSSCLLYLITFCWTLDSTFDPLLPPSYLDPRPSSRPLRRPAWRPRATSAPRVWRRASLARASRAGRCSHRYRTGHWLVFVQMELISHEQKSNPTKMAIIRLILPNQEHRHRVSDHQHHLFTQRITFSSRNILTRILFLSSLIFGRLSGRHGFSAFASCARFRTAWRRH